MPEPMNYMLQGLQNPADAVMQGFKESVGFQQDRLKFAQDQADAAAKRQAEVNRQNALQSVYDNPTPSGIAKLMVRYPEMGKDLKFAYDSMSSEARNSATSSASRVYAAVMSGNNDIATQMLQEQAEAARNSGRPEDAKHAETMAELIKVSPNTAKTSIGMFLSNAMGPDKFAESFSKLGGEERAAERAPSELKESIAKADKAAVEAKFAESNAVKDLEKKGWDIDKIKNDIDVSKQNVRIAAANLALAREDNAIKRQELGLKLKDMQDKREETVRAKSAEAEGAMQFADSTSALLDWMVDPKQKSARESATGTVSMTLPGTEGRTYVTKIEQLSNMMALPNLDKLKGAMSDKDVAFLKNISANLNRDQKESDFLKELGRLQKFMKDKKDSIRKRYGAPAPAQRSIEESYEVDF